MTRTPLLSAALMMLLLLLLLPATLTQTTELDPIVVVVENTLLQTKPESFSTRVADRGILLGAMRRLMASNEKFSFTVSEDLNYGVFLQSVNGVTGSREDGTSWKLLVQTPDGNTFMPDVGIGCFVPSPGDRIILRLTKGL